MFCLDAGEVSTPGESKACGRMDLQSIDEKRPARRKIGDSLVYAFARATSGVD